MDFFLSKCKYGIKTVSYALNVSTIATDSITGDIGSSDLPIDSINGDILSFSLYR